MKEDVNKPLLIITFFLGKNKKILRRHLCQTFNPVAWKDIAHDMATAVTLHCSWEWLHLSRLPALLQITGYSCKPLLQKMV